MQQNEDLAWLVGVLRDAFAPDPDITVSEWADRHRMLGLRASSEVGPWRTSRTPYLRDIMDALSPSHPAQKIVFMKGAQVGGTECGNNWIGYVIHCAPGPFLAVQPNTEMAKRFSRQRIDSLIQETSVLRDRVGAPKSRDSSNRQLEKEFPGGTLVLTGAESGVGLRSMSVRYLFLDEVDAYTASADNEGDPISLAIARTNTYTWRRKIFIVSTPKIAGRSRIELEYQLTDQRRYYVPCPHCGHRQTLRFDRLRWEKGMPETAAYVCESCEKPIEEQYKDYMLANGAWVAEATSTDPRAIGFHLSALYSPYGWLSWADVARQWERARSNIEMLRAFKNTILGEPWQERGDAPDWQRLLERREPYPLGVVPEEGLVLTAGVDVQDDRLECDVWAWGRGFTSWLVDHIVLYGIPREAAVWDALAEVLEKDWPCADGGTRKIARACVDTGGRDTTSVYQHLVRLRRPQLIAPTKGIDGWNHNEPVRGPTKVFRNLLNLWIVATATWKAELYRRLWLTRDGDDYPPGWVHIPSGVEAEWVRQLVAEELRTVRTRLGFARQEWAKLRERNEALDCAVLARAALWLLGADARGERFWNAWESRAAASRQIIIDSDSDLKDNGTETTSSGIKRLQPRPRWEPAPGW